MEPYFEDTMKHSFVKIGFSQRYVIAQIMELKEDTSNLYTLTNGTKTGIYFKLLLTENSPEKMKWFKIIQISNSEISAQEFDKFVQMRDFYKVPRVNMETVEKKSQDIYNARHYIYKKGEAEAIAERKFERAMKEGTLHRFPNVPFF